MWVTHHFLERDSVLGFSNNKPMSAFQKIFRWQKNTSERTVMIKEITIGEEKLEIDLDGAPLWKIWILHIVLLVRFGKLLKESSQCQR